MGQWRIICCNISILQSKPCNVSLERKKVTLNLYSEAGTYKITLVVEGTDANDETSKTYVAGSAAMAVPSTASSMISYPPVAQPVPDNNVTNCKPMGIGNNEAGKFNLQISLPALCGSVDVYLALYASAIDPYHLYFFLPGPALRLAADTLTPWISNTTGPISNQIFTQDIELSALPAGTYSFFLAVTPHEDLTEFYFWNTNMVIP